MVSRAFSAVHHSERGLEQHTVAPKRVTHLHPRHPRPIAPWYWAVALTVAAGLGTLLAGQRADDTHGVAASDLVRQVIRAGQGDVPARNIYGGRVSVRGAGNQVVVTVDKIPSKACVSAGWDLVHKGVLTVNGETPPRISAGILSELCYEQATATLSWSPRVGG